MGEGGISPEPRRAAILRVLAGESPKSIAREFGVSPRVVEDWLNVAQTEAKPRDPRSQQTPPAIQRRDLARRLLVTPDFVSVWDPKEQDPDYDDPTYNLEVVYKDYLATVFEELVKESVSVIQTFSGVDHVLHDDRELIRIAGSARPSLLRDRLVSWWVERLREIAD